MNFLALTLLVALGTILFVLPRRWAPVPLLAAALYMTAGQGVELGSLSLPAYRVMLMLGFLRALLRREYLIGGVNSIDRLMLAWACWVILASFFHLSEPGSGPVFAAGYAMNVALSYFLVRAWCRGLDEVHGLLKVVGILLAPVALSMAFEHFLEKNLFAMLGGASELVSARDGKIRSQGPFQHSILAGTVGSASVAYMIAIWKQHRTFAAVGLVASITMVLSSNSSGPLMSLVVTVAAIVAWRWRYWTKALRYAALALYFMLEIVMPAPAYYVISKFDLTGSSTGWHRGKLIESAIEHFSEWWLFGTDYTFHWTGVANWSQRHSDITNYYIAIGVVGGFPALLLTIMMMWRAFAWVGSLAKGDEISSVQHKFSIWCLGAGLFSLAASSLSVAYFDQSVVFFWLNVSLISLLHSSSTHTQTDSGLARGAASPCRPTSRASAHRASQLQARDP